jgi:hypothetical protein
MQTVNTQMRSYPPIPRLLITGGAIGSPSIYDGDAD